MAEIQGCFSAAAAAKSLQSCPTLCDPVDGSPAGSPSWDSPGKNAGVGCHFLLQCMQVKSEREVAQSSPTLSSSAGSPQNKRVFLFPVNDRLSQELWQEKSKKGVGKPKKKWSRLQEMMGLKEICRLHTAGKVKENTPTQGDHVLTGTRLLKASAGLSAERQKDVFSAGACGVITTQPPSTTGLLFFWVQKKPPRCEVLGKNYKWLFSQNRWAGSPSNTTVLRGAQALEAWRGNIALGWKEHCPLFQQAQRTEVTTPC